MDEAVMDTYGILLIIKEIDFPVRGKENVKFFSSNEKYLDEFLNSWSDAQDLMDYLMPDIDQAFANPGNEFENGSATINVSIDSIKTDFFNDEFEFLFTLPTSDFRMIVQGWINFLESAPANRSKVKWRLFKKKNVQTPILNDYGIEFQSVRANGEKLGLVNQTTVSDISFCLCSYLSEQTTVNFLEDEVLISINNALQGNSFEADGGGVTMFLQVGSPNSVFSDLGDRSHSISIKTTDLKEIITSWIHFLKKIN